MSQLRTISSTSSANIVLQLDICKDLIGSAVSAAVSSAVFSVAPASVVSRCCESLAGADGHAVHRGQVPSMFQIVPAA